MANNIFGRCPDHVGNGDTFLRPSHQNYNLITNHGSATRPHSTRTQLMLKYSTPVIFAFISAAHFVLPMNLISFSLLIFIFSIANALRASPAFQVGTSAPSVKYEKALWWLAFLILSYRLAILARGYI
ncbi:hypothetical protein [Rhodobacter sp. JA431]|uniref:hypothetical protein n=1 Tax=Rhodobacter sp. JA431 TaxID=570013 RepID=UPI001160942E|nr:hypothetical protein [Rhodobacter sp. JA431]